ncbi:MAG: MBL fold metallo-hydrolase [Methanomicrobiales archaeon]|nr:MBL fold metallo-hydrolase [Methanomicrobiales archaeon]
MPAGSEPLIPLQWQPVPGCGEARIYPLIRKVDTVSSNSFLVQTSDAIILIDPGGLPAQAAHLASLIQAIQAERALPLVVMLTHGHVDHYVAALSVPLLVDPCTAMVALQEHGVEVVESADRRMTQAEVLGRELAPMRIDLHLLAASNAEGGGEPVRCRYANGVTVTVVQKPMESGLPQEELILGSGPRIEVYHTPGHSADSCCFQIGGLFFTGDLLLAASPGIAGISGWDQEALIRSLDKVRALLSCGGIEVVCLGHGPMLSVKDGARVLEAVQRDARRLTGIAELDPERARQTAAFAEDCMEQVHELFTVMAGRLYYVSHMMEELEETDIARGLHALIRGDVIDDLLDGFDAFNREYHSGGYVPLNLALKGGQVVGKLQRSFNQDELTQIIDPTLVQRAERLLGDYITMLRGFSPPRGIAVHDLRELLEGCIREHTVRSRSDDDVLASTDDDVAFGRMLLARIGMPPLLADTAATVDLGAGPLSVPVDKERFLDLVTYLLEDLVGGGAATIAVRAGREGEAALVTLLGDGCDEPLTCGGKPHRFLYSLCERAGGNLHFTDREGSRWYTIRFTPV